ncbi:FAD-dependent oxidoreductase [Limibacillus sp. MBR-115]|jgi:fumarate reductase flavoprotein subunit|uniref:FAD-dependent oxidoreductase n=1 Tax=Limibacillus sp. MBR-115 TaxID=3156465 RepID=UPI00339B21D5
MPKNTFDVVVVGGGGSGLTAALTAGRLGREVVLLEKNPALGGTTGLSVGSISCNSTPQQKAAGISDSPDEHFEDMGKFAGALEPRDNLDLRRLYVENVPEAFRFLMDLGIEFMGPVPEPPHRYPRLHNIVPHSRGYIYRLVKHCRREGVEIRTNAPVVELLRDGDRVTGVRLADGTEIKARRGVVLASGDYSSADGALKSEFLPEALCDVEGINTTSTGDGQRLGRDAGSEVLNPDLAWGPEMRFIAPPKPSIITRIPPIRPFARLVNWAIKNLPQPILRPFLMSFVTTFLAPSHGLFKEGALLVNSEGKRFCDERDGPQHTVSAQPGRTAYILMDDAMARKFTAWPHYISTAPGVAYAYLPDYQRNRKDICFKAATVAALAAKVNLPAKALQETLDQANAEARDSGRAPLSEGPFYLLGPLKSWICFTEGGLKVDKTLQVLRGDGSPITGLFAAGSTGQGGLLLEGHGHHLGWAVTSGRIAGRSAAFQTVV